MVTENTTPELQLARFVQRLAGGGHADWAERGNSENQLRQSVLDEVVEPLLCDLLNTFEDRVIKPLRSLDDYPLTDRSLGFVERLRSMSPSGQQVFGDTLLWIGALIVKTGVVGEARDSLNSAAAHLYGNEIDKFLRRDGDIVETLHRTFAAADARRTAGRRTDARSLCAMFGRSANSEPALSTCSIERSIHVFRSQRAGQEGSRNADQRSRRRHEVLPGRRL